MVRMEELKRRLELHRFVRLRQRYILTRHNKVRLRYLAGSSATLVLAFMAAWNDSGLASLRAHTALALSYEVAEATVPSETLKMAQISPAAGDQSVSAQKSHAGALQGEANIKPEAVALAQNVQSVISEGIRKAAFIMKKPDPAAIQEIEIGQGDTITGVLEKAGVNSDDAYQAVKALSTHMDPRNVQPGQVIDVQFKPDGGEMLAFAKMTMDVDALRTVTVKKQGDDFTTRLEEKALKPHTYAGYAKIESSLYGSAERAGIPPQVLADVIRLYSRTIDFQRDIQKGDEIRILYDGQETEDGEYKKYGGILYASLTVGGRTVPFYRYVDKDGRTDYYDQQGRTTRKTLLKTPIDGARVSSGYGMRMHPILGYTRMHKGIDFAAPMGTPIYASGDGVVEFAGKRNGYGNFVILRHNSDLKTGYGHMRGFAKGIHSGVRVKQGDVIAYVGSEGRSTGPHLHYEVMVRGRQVNPRSIDLPTGQNLAGRELARFKETIAGLRQQYAYLTDGVKVAQGDASSVYSHLN